jgi:asparagine synthase (glutamine-hydrolysing)
VCGILGTVNRPVVGEVLDLLRHRGPDDSAIAEWNVGDHIVTFGHRRLSILDPSSAGAQPMSSGRYSIVFNGEIYNHEELRTRMGGVQYHGHSDTETILHYLARHPVSSIIDFNGIFALGFLDEERQTLFLARDPFGVKPLYYWPDDESLVFSSELKIIREFVHDSLDLDNLAELLRLRYLPAPDTLFKKIRKIRPGHLLEVDLRGSRLKIRDYPFVGRSNSVATVRSRTAAVERYGVLLERAVKRQLMSDVEIGVFLSGGVDSAMIASIAQRHAGYKMKAFTVGFAERGEADEIDEARKTAQVLGLDHYVVQIGFSDFLDLMPRISTIVEEPLATDSVVPMFHLSALASKHVRVVLSGQGADEVMGGYRRYQAELFRRFIPRFAVPMMMKAGAQVRDDTVRRAIGSMSAPDDVGRFEAIYKVFDTQQITRLIGHDSHKAEERIRYFYDLLECSRQRGSAERMMSLDLRMNLADDLLLYTDKITMCHSIECRVPLLDIDLVKFAESLPANYRLGVLRGKTLHKKFARRLLPSSIVQRKKKGFLSPTVSWLKDTRVLKSILLNPSSQFSTYFDSGEVENVLNEQAAGLNRKRQIFLLLSLCYWMDTYLRCDHTTHVVDA